MKARSAIPKMILLLAALILTPLFSPAVARAEEPASLQASGLSGEAAILIDGRTGTVLFAKNAERRMYPASITKIVTAIIALETTDPEELVTVSKTAREEEGTRIYLAEGETKPMVDMVYGLMLNSGNDAATAIAEHIDGTKEKFAERMNAFVREKAGAFDSHFMNPSGLPDAEHYTTAADMAAIARYAMKNEDFRTIVGTKSMPWNGLEWQSSLVNHNRLIGNYEGATGIKNGFTLEAKSTLVASAERDDLSLIGVVLKATTTDSLYDDMRKILDYGFAAFEQKQVLAQSALYRQSKEGGSAFVAKEPLTAVVPRGETPIYAVSAAGEALLATPLGVQTIGRLERIREPLALRDEYETLAEAAESAQSQRASSPSETREVRSGFGYADAGFVATVAALAAAGIAMRLRRKKQNETEESA